MVDTKLLVNMKDYRLIDKQLVRFASVDPSSDKSRLFNDFPKVTGVVPPKIKTGTKVKRYIPTTGFPAAE